MKSTDDQSLTRSRKVASVVTETLRWIHLVIDPLSFARSFTEEEERRRYEAAVRREVSRYIFYDGVSIVMNFLFPCVNKRVL